MERGLFYVGRSMAPVRRGKKFSLTYATAFSQKQSGRDRYRGGRSFVQHEILAQAELHCTGTKYEMEY